MNNSPIQVLETPALPIRESASNPSQTRRSGAFTLIEMMVVLFIVAILAGIVISVAGRVTQGGKVSATRNVLEVADSLLTDYVTTREAPAPQFLRTSKTQLNTTGTDDQLSPDTYVFPIIDGRYDGRMLGGGIGSQSPRWDVNLDPAQPSGALLLLAIRQESSEVERKAQAVEARFIQERDVYAYGWLADPSSGEPSGQLIRRRLRIPVLVDAFGNMVRFVHPGFQGGYGNYFNNATPPANTVRPLLKVLLSRSGGGSVVADFSRSYRPFGANVPGDPVGDADEGLAVGGHGYFYSPGADRDPGTREDNVYTKKPGFPTETVKLN